MFYFVRLFPLIKHVQLAFEQVRFVRRISLNALLDDAFPSRGRVMARTTVMIHQTKTNIAVVSNLRLALRHGEYASAFHLPAIFFQTLFDVIMGERLAGVRLPKLTRPPKGV